MDRNKVGVAALRKGRWSARNQIYLITSCTSNRLQIFADFNNARSLIKILKAESMRGSCSTLAFVIMPDHFHWLIQLGFDDLSVIVGRVKSLMARTVGKPIWQKGFHDHGLRTEEDLRAIARYIIMNPVRAGLADRPGLYSHWDAVWL
jgi:putative transposase